MATLQTLQSYLINDLRVFRAPFFADMEKIPGGDPASKSGPSQALYRVRSLSTFETWHISGIVGGRRPSTYSESPRIWHSYFDRAGFKGVYFGFDLPHEKDFQAFLEAFAAVPGALDLTVTDPYKNRAFHTVKALKSPVAFSEQAEHTEMVNHIIVDRGNEKISALNTDGLGMVLALRGMMDLQGRKVLVFGAGGSAATIGYELVKAGNDLQILNRTPDRAKALAERLGTLKGPGQELGWSGFEEMQDRLPQADIIINALPEGCPMNSSHAGLLKRGVLLAETTYGHKSALRALAEAADTLYVDGTGMLFGQFVEAMAHVFPVLGISAERHSRVMDSLTG
jgi:shikimate dehydrogenase